MTPKEKADELYRWYIDYTFGYFNCKQCTLIAVDEIIKSEPLEPNNTPDWLEPEDWFSEANKSAAEYWLEVKQEIEKL